MPFEMQIIKAREFLRMGVHGRIDLQASCDVLQELAAACAKRDINRAMLDVRDVRSELNNDEVVALATALGAMGFSENTRVAVLHGEDREAQARLFTSCAMARGWNLRPFFDFEEATDWLAIAEDADQLDNIDLGTGDGPDRDKPDAAPPKSPAKPPKKRPK